MSQPVSNMLDLGKFLKSKCSENQLQINNEQIDLLLKEYQQSNQAKEAEQKEKINVAIKNSEPSSGIRKLSKNSFNQQKLDKIKEVMEKKNKQQLQMIQEYKAFKDQLEKNKRNNEGEDSFENDDDEPGNEQKAKSNNQDDGGKRFHCFKQDCQKKYGTDKARRLHIVNKHKMLAVQLTYIKHLCEICEEYHTNNFASYEQHLEACASNQARLLGLQGVHFENELKLSKEQKLMLEKAKQFQ